MVLNTQPTADVTIALSSSDTTEGTVGPASLTFTTANWNVAQTVTVTGVDDAAGRRRRRLHDRDGAGGEHGPELHRRRMPADVAVSNTDNDVAGITVTPTAGLTTTEARRDGDVYGGAQHAADGGRDDCAELERHDRRHGPPASLIFTTANWNVAQTVTVTGVDDALVDGAVGVHDRDGAGGEHGPELQRRRMRPTWR